MGGDPNKAAQEYLNVPGLYLIGSVPDGFRMLPTIEAEYAPAMQRGNVFWTCALSWGAAHDWLPPTTPYAITYLDQIIKLRYPADDAAPGAAAKLRELKWEDGWAGDRATWDSPCPAITAYSAYKGSKENLSWQPNRYLAHVWRAYVTKSPEVSFVDIEPASPVADNPKRNEYCVAAESRFAATARVKDGVEVKSVSFFDGDVLLGQAKQAPFSFRWEQVPPGNHALIAVAELRDGQPRCSGVLWLVADDRKRP
jgi:hypothetical protein